MNISERLKSLPDSSLAIIAASHNQLIEAHRTNYLEIDMRKNSHKPRYHTLHPYFLPNHVFTLPYEDSLRISKITGSDPFLALSYHPHVTKNYSLEIVSPLEVYKIFFTLNIQGYEIDQVKEEFVNLMEDKIGSIEDRITHFAKPQRRPQAQA